MSIEAASNWLDSIWDVPAFWPSELRAQHFRRIFEGKQCGARAMATQDESAHGLLGWGVPLITSKANLSIVIIYLTHKSINQNSCKFFKDYHATTKQIPETCPVMVQKDCMYLLAAIYSNSRSCGLALSLSPPAVWHLYGRYGRKSCGMQCVASHNSFNSVPQKCRGWRSKIGRNRTTYINKPHISHVKIC